MLRLSAGIVMWSAVLALGLAGCGRKEQPAPKGGSPAVGAAAPDQAAPSEAPEPAGPVDYTAESVGTLTAGEGKASADTDVWPQFRGPSRDNIVAAAKNLLRAWPEGGPKELWRIEGLGGGYSSPAVWGGKAYFNDYDEKLKLWMVRCASLADGKEIWRWSYPRTVVPNHYITRSVPVVDGKYVVSIDPKCVVHGFDAATGKRLWAKDLTRAYGAKIPMWYNGQCPLDDGDKVILGVGGKSVLLAAFDKATGKAVWETPNPDGLAMTHSSVMSATIGGVKQFVWATMNGVVGVDAADGRQLWKAPWTGKTAVAPSALALPGGLVFMTSGYQAGSIMNQVEKQGESYAARTLFKLTDREFNSECHTPILWQDHLFAIDREGRFTCLSLDGKPVWQNAPGKNGLGLGSFLLADGMFFVLEGDTGTLRLIEAGTKEYKELASAQKLGGHDVWAPMVLINGKLLVRDLTKMLCLEVGK